MFPQTINNNNNNNRNMCVTVQKVFGVLVFVIPFRNVSLNRHVQTL